MPFLLVTDTPTNFTATRTGLLTVETSWTAPASNIPPVEGYEVFYENELGVRTSGGNTTVPQVGLMLSSLEPDVSYTAFVVAFGGDPISPCLLPSTCVLPCVLPSAYSNTANIPAGKISLRQPPLCFT